MTKPSKYFPSQISDDHFVEIVETATGKVEKRMGPMSESKVDKVEMGVLHRIDLERFFVRTGTDAALKREAQPSSTSCGLCGLGPSAPRHKKMDMQSYHLFEEEGPTITQLERAGIVSSDPNAKRTKPAGSSPTLRIACPVCLAPAGSYCLKNGRNEVQVIAHKRRREEEERTR